MMETLGMTTSACPACGRLVPAKIVSDGRDVFFRKHCPQHGESQAFVRSDADDYLRTLRYVKPAWVPREFAGDASADCPRGCGFCSRHEQHLCMPIIEITSRCDLECPVCLVDAGRPWDMSLAEFRRVLDGLLRAESQIDVLNVSGGEPLLHPDLPAFVDEALSRGHGSVRATAAVARRGRRPAPTRPGIIRVSISTNGLRLLDDRKLLRSLRDRNACISLQLDGFDDRAYEILRGRPLLAEKLRILDLLAEEGVSTSLTMTVAGGVNDDQFRPMLDCLFSREHVVSMMIQPVAFAGRGAGLAGSAKRMTIPDVIAGLAGAGHPAVSAQDFVPLPCGSPLCFSLAFYLMADGGKPVAFTSFINAGEMLDAVSNRVFFGLEPAEYEHLQRTIYELWSGPAGSLPQGEAVMATVRKLLRATSCCGFDPKRLFAEAERCVKSIFIHAFMDADTFDLARVRRCCNAYPQPDGRLVPACVHNVLDGRRTGGGNEQR